MKYLEKCNNLYNHISNFKELLHEDKFKIVSDEFDYLFTIINHENISVLDIGKGIDETHYLSLEEIPFCGNFFPVKRTITSLSVRGNKLGINYADDSDL